MKNILLCLCIGMILSACDIWTRGNKVVPYNQLSEEKNYWDSIPGRVKVRDAARPHRYYLYNEPYTGRVEDTLSTSKPKLSGAFKDGYPVGPWRYYHLNASLSEEGSYDNDGYMSGEWKFYDNAGEIAKKVIYKRNGHYLSADTLLMVYKDGSRKEWAKEKIHLYYPNGKVEAEVSPDGSTGTWWDESGQVTWKMKDYIKHSEVTDETIYYVARGKNQKAYQALLDCWKWSDRQKEKFANASSVTVIPQMPFSPFKIGYTVRVESY